MKVLGKAEALRLVDGARPAGRALESGEPLLVSDWIAHFIDQVVDDGGASWR